jgi:hypothetical protein
VTEFLLLANIVLAGALLLDGLRRRGGYIEVPFLSAAIYVVWFVPQAIVLVDDSTLPPGALARVLAMSFLCLIAIWWGWRFGSGGRSGVRQPIAIPMRQLFMPTLIVTVFSVVMHVAILTQPDDVRAMTQWSGPITILYFLAQAGVVSLVLSIAIVLHKRTPETIFLAGANLAFYVPAVLIYFRRTETFELAFALLLGLYFVKGRVIPRAAIIAAICLSVFFIHGIALLRDLGGGYTQNNAGRIVTHIPTIEEISQIDWLSAVDFNRTRLHSETRSAAMYMEVTDVRGIYTFGAGIYNLLVNAYIPGQIVGFEFKHSLLMGADQSQIAFESTGYEAIVGGTPTGFADTYRDFWFFGAGIFFLTAFLMGRMFSRALSGSLYAFGLYASTLSLPILAITHYGYYFFVNSPILVVTLWLVIKSAANVRRKFPAGQFRPKLRQLS